MANARRAFSVLIEMQLMMSVFDFVRCRSYSHTGMHKNVVRLERDMNNNVVSKVLQRPFSHEFYSGAFFSSKVLQQYFSHLNTHQDLREGSRDLKIVKPLIIELGEQNQITQNIH